jgi:hypothetical protein
MRSHDPRWLPLTLSLVLIAGCGDDEVGTLQQAGNSVCLKVCLDAKAAVCETYCPPAVGCKLVCDSNALILGTDPNTDPATGTDPAKKPTSKICQWSCPTPPSCKQVCDPSCTTNGQPGSATGCCKEDCGQPTPTPAPCSQQCDQACFAKLKTTPGVAESDLVAKCCTQSCPPTPPPCAQQCDPQCMATLKNDPNAAESDLVAKCCKQSCPSPTPCVEQCDQTCLASFKSDPNAAGTDAHAKCCKQDCGGQVLPCVQQCDQTCLDSLLKMGIAEKDAAAKCCACK